MVGFDISIIILIILGLFYPLAYLLKYYKNKKSLRQIENIEDVLSETHNLGTSAESLLEQENPTLLHDQWVQVYQAHDNAEAHLVRALLESYGIPSFLKGDQHRSLLGWQGGILIPVDVWVPQTESERAKELIHANPSIEE